MNREQAQEIGQRAASRVLKPECEQLLEQFLECQCGKKPQRKWLVVDNAFNRANYPTLVNKTFDAPPGYAGVREVELTEGSQENITGPLIPNRPTRDEVKVTLWEERDRMHIGIVDKATEQISFADWWDDEARQMFEDGFFKSGRQMENSVLDYAKTLGIID